MFKHRIFLAILTALIAGLALAPSQAGEFSALVNGKSFHAGAIEDWNEENYGFGVEYEFSSASRWKTRLMANSFVDSTDNMSHMAGAGLHRRLWQTGRFHDLYVDIGINAFLMTRKDVNDNRPFPGVLPSLTIGNRNVGINLTWLPREALEAVYDSKNMDRGLAGIVYLQLKLSSAFFTRKN